MEINFLFAPVSDVVLEGSGISPDRREEFLGIYAHSGCLLRLLLTPSPFAPPWTGAAQQISWVWPQAFPPGHTAWPISKRDRCGENGVMEVAIVVSSCFYRSDRTGLIPPPPGWSPFHTTLLMFSLL